MLRQYHASRRQGGHNPLGIGVIPAGAIFYLQDDGWWRDRFRGAPLCREPWIVESFLSGTLSAARRNAETGRWEDLYMARRSDMAVVRSLRNGRRQRVAVRLLILHEDEGLRRDEATYPSLPKADRQVQGSIVRKLPFKNFGRLCLQSPQLSPLAQLPKAGTLPAYRVLLGVAPSEPTA